MDPSYRPASLRSDILFTIAVLAAIAIAWAVRDVLLLIYVSALFAVVVSPAIELVRRVHIGRWRPGRGTAILLLLLFGLVLAAGFVLLAVPPMVRDLQAFAADLPRRTGALMARMRTLPLANGLDPAVLEQHAAQAVGGAFGVFRTITGGVFGVFSCAILTAYFILDGQRAFAWLKSLVPIRQRPRLEATLIRAERRVRHWLVGQFGLMLTLGSCAFVAFWLMRIKYFYALAVIAGVLNIVPIIGPLTSLVLTGIVAAFDSWAKLGGVLAFYFLYQQVETAFLTPRIMKFSVDLPPLAVIIALSLGGALAGVLGALIAVPTAALIAVLADDYLVQKDADTLGTAAAGPD
jgi:predicted PurR-regulated permease PerM